MKAVLMLLRSFNWSIQPPPLLPALPLVFTAVTVLQPVGEKYLSDSIPPVFSLAFCERAKMAEYNDDDDGDW